MPKRVLAFVLVAFLVGVSSLCCAAQVHEVHMEGGSRAGGVTLLVQIVIAGVSTLIAVLLLWITWKQARIASSTAIRTIQEDIAKLLCGKTVRQIAGDDVKELEFRAVLDPSPEWKFKPDEQYGEEMGQVRPAHKLLDGQRHWLIRQCERNGTQVKQYVSSGTFLSTQLWFNRIAMARRAGIIRKRHLSQLWTYVLPFGYSGRLAYFARYFFSEEQIRPMIYVVNETLDFCRKRGHKAAIRDFEDHVTASDQRILKSARTDRSSP